MSVSNEPRLDTELLLTRMREQGLGTRALASRVGVSITAVRHLMRGSKTTQISLREFCRLAAALAVDPSALLSGPIGAEGPAEATDDARLLGMALGAQARVVPESAVCRRLGWTLERLRAAEQALDEGLGGLGLRVHRYRGTHVGLRAVTAPTSELREAIDALALAEGEPPMPALRLLRQIVDAPRKPPPSSRVGAQSAGTLMRLGLVDPDLQHLRLSAAGRDALLLDALSEWLPGAREDTGRSDGAADAGAGSDRAPADSPGARRDSVHARLLREARFEGERAVLDLPPPRPGDSGIARVRVSPGTSSFSRWLVRTGKGRPDPIDGGVVLLPPVQLCGQSLTRMLAWAESTAAALRADGLGAVAEGAHT